MLYQKAEGVWPERVRPDLSVMVTEIMIGSLWPVFSNTSSIAKSAALALSVSKMVSTRRTSTPPSIKASVCSV